MAHMTLAQEILTSTGSRLLEAQLSKPAKIAPIGGQVHEIKGFNLLAMQMRTVEKAKHVAGSQRSFWATSILL